MSDKRFANTQINEQAGAWQKRCQELEAEQGEIARYLYGDPHMERLLADLGGKPTPARMVASLVAELGRLEAVVSDVQKVLDDDHTGKTYVPLDTIRRIMEAS